MPEREQTGVYIQEVHDRRVRLVFDQLRPVTLRHVEQFCEALRAARASGDLPIGLRRDMVEGIEVFTMSGEQSILPGWSAT